jgi:acyl-CoA thioesterase FadM
MDAVLGTLVQVQGIVAVTAGLEVRFLQSVTVDETVDLGGRIAAVEGRKVRVEGWIDHEGVRCVEARALFVAVDREPG